MASLVDLCFVFCIYILRYIYILAYGFRSDFINTIYGFRVAWLFSNKYRCCVKFLDHEEFCSPQYLSGIHSVRVWSHRPHIRHKTRESGPPPHTHTNTHTLVPLFQFSWHLTLFGLVGGGRKCPRRFQLSIISMKFKEYLPNVATFTKIYWRTRFWKRIWVKGIACCHGNPVFDIMLTQILTF